MGPLGMPELIMIFVVLILLALPAGIAIVLLWYFYLKRHGCPVKFNSSF